MLYGCTTFCRKHQDKEKNYLKETSFWNFRLRHISIWYDVWSEGSLKGILEKKAFWCSVKIDEKTIIMWSIFRCTYVISFRPRGSNFNCIGILSRLLSFAFTFRLYLYFPLLPFFSFPKLSLRDRLSLNLTVRVPFICISLTGCSETYVQDFCQTFMMKLSCENSHKLLTIFAK